MGIQGGGANSGHEKKQTPAGRGARGGRPSAGFEKTTRGEKKETEKERGVQAPWPKASARVVNSN